MSNLRSNLIRVASTLPAGDPGRGDILHVIRENDMRLAFDKVSASKLPTVVVQGYEGFVDQVRVLSDLENKTNTLKDQLEAIAGDLPKQIEEAEKEYKDQQESIKKAYKTELGAQGNIIIERKTALTKAIANLQSSAMPRTLNAIQAELLAKVTEKYGAEVADFIKVTTEALQEQDKTLRVVFKGFSLESREGKKAFNVVQVLAQFRDYIKKSWQKIVDIAKTATSVMKNRSSKVDKAHTEFMKAIEAVNKG